MIKDPRYCQYHHAAGAIMIIMPLFTTGTAVVGQNDATMANELELRLKVNLLLCSFPLEVARSNY